jgi:acetyltransferase
MSVRHLEYLFRPRSIAVIGASDRPQSVGATVIRNLLAGGFAGPIAPVNLKHDEVAGRRAYRDVASLPETPDLAIICTPPQTIPGLIAELGARGTKAAIVLTAGLAAAKDGRGYSLQTAMLQAAKPHLLRILGPNCVGLLAPQLGLNASFAHVAARPGPIAFVSQSGALATALLDWANSRDIGFSHFISMGDSADVDFGDVLDYLASDPGTRSILMYVESISAPRKFMSAARAAARNKPVLLVKSGRAPEGAKAAASHTGAMTGSDLVFDAAIRRAGMLRVSTLADLFVVAETLARAKPLAGDRLAIMTNGGGAGVLAADALSLGGGKLATLSAELMNHLNGVLPPTWSHGNPVDMIGDAPVARYVETLRALLECPDIDSVLFMHAPTAIVPSAEIAHACAPLAQAAARQVLSCWLGGDGVAKARQIFAGAGVPVYDTPEQAVGAFLNVVNYNRNQELLLQSPSSAPLSFPCDCDAARGLIGEVLAGGRNMLTEPEAKQLLAAYGVSVVETRTAANVNDAAAAAAAIARPVVLKILSPDISHKSDVGGVALGLETPDAVRAAAEGMLERVRRLRPDAAITGFTVQEMITRPRAHELIVGVACDPIFGPVVLFGHGGTGVEAIADRAVALPPLNAALARDLIAGTRVARLLAGYRDRLPVNADALHQVLMQVSQLVCDLPEVAELDINPLLADDQGVIALDARVRVAPAAAPGAARLAIRPYPAELEERVRQDGGDLLVRPIRPEDESGLRALIAAARSREASAPSFIQRLADSDIARLTQIDYEREMTFLAISGSQILAAIRGLSDPDNVRTEFAALVHPSAAEQGLERLLVAKLMDYLRRRGGREAHCVCSPTERGLIAAAMALGFGCEQNADAGVVALCFHLS